MVGILVLVTLASAAPLDATSGVGTQALSSSLPQSMGPDIK